MGRGGYLGGSTILRPGSDWFSKPKPPKNKKKKKSTNQSEANAGASQKQMTKAQSKLQNFKDQIANRPAIEQGSRSGRVVMRDHDAGIVIERKGGKTRRILLPVTGSSSSRFRR
jgi:hypothetical protein